MARRGKKGLDRDGLDAVVPGGGEDMWRAADDEDDGPRGGGPGADRGAARCDGLEAPAGSRNRPYDEWT